MSVFNDDSLSRVCVFLVLETSTPDGHRCNLNGVGDGVCLNQVCSAKLPICGDGDLDTGEDCDCGSNDCTGIDPLCDGRTCLLVDMTTTPELTTAEPTTTEPTTAEPTTPDPTTLEPTTTPQSKSYTQVDGGCDESSTCTITTLEECQTAAQFLGRTDTESNSIDTTTEVKGCSTNK